MTDIEKYTLAVEITGVLLLPLALFFAAKLFANAKEKSETAIRDSDQISKYIELLASPNKTETMLALLALANLKQNGHLNGELLNAVEYFLNDADPVIAAKAEFLISGEKSVAHLKLKEQRLTFTVLLPLKVHLERTKNLFTVWVNNNANKPNENIEAHVKEANETIRDILIEKWHLLPNSLQGDANKLIKHYNDWLDKFDAVRPNGIRTDKPNFVFVGNFPAEAEKNFKAYLVKLLDA